MSNEQKKDPAKPRFIIDGHVDVVYMMNESQLHIPFEKLRDFPVTFEKMSNANVQAIVAALYCPDLHNGDGTSAYYLSQLIAFAEKYLTELHHIITAADLNDCIQQRTPGLILLVENADGLLEIDRGILSRNGIKVAGLTHMGRNRIGDGNNVPFPEGLTSAGQRLVKELAQEGFAFDVAHLAEPGFRDLVRIYEGPLLSSHTGVRALCDIPRNLTKDQIRIILERKGVVGIAADPKMLTPSGEACIEDTFRHIDWIAQSFEADGIAIGSDFCGFTTTNSGLEDISRLPDLADILLKHGYSELSVQKIMGKNWQNFYSVLLG
ncbi:MAG: dipeptidase [Syntrophobacteraceae bacterium]